MYMYIAAEASATCPLSALYSKPSQIANSSPYLAKNVLFERVARLHRLLRFCPPPHNIESISIRCDYPYIHEQ